MKRMKGFTLIELLIVVAIIAILAAIAVPNFLEAQVRAKVSRAHSDMRSIATGIESYAVDHGKYPPGWNQLSGNPGETSWKAPNAIIGDQYGQMLLTTPISYMSTIPRDPFRTTGTLQKSGTTWQNIADYKWYFYRPTWHTQKAANWAVMDLSVRRGFTWAMYSVGPSRNGNDAGIFNILAGFVSWIASTDPPNAPPPRGIPV